MPCDPDPALGTQTVAVVLQLAARTVSKLIDSGRLPGYRLPGSKTRRVLRSDLVAFCEREQLPAPIVDRARNAVRDYHGRPRKSCPCAGRCSNT